MNMGSFAVGVLQLHISLWSVSIRPFAIKLSHNVQGSCCCLNVVGALNRDPLKSTEFD